MKYLCTRTCGVYRKGHEYQIERPLPVLALSAIRAGHLVAAEGWCAPSETLYDMTPILATGGLLSLPVEKAKAVIKTMVDELDNQPEEPVKPKRKPRKKVAETTTLESLAAETAQAMEGLRGPAAI